MLPIRYLNFQPYESQEIEAIYNHYGEEGYLPKKFLGLTFFKKTDKKYSFKVACIDLSGKSRIKKTDARFELASRYQDAGYTLFKDQKGKFVFYKEGKTNHRNDLNYTYQFDHFDTIKYAMFALMYLTLSFAYTLFIIDRNPLNDFLTYGSFLFQIAFVAILMTLGLRYLCHFISLLRFKSKKPLLKHIRSLFITLLLVFTIIFVGGIAEDSLNATLTTQYPYMSLSKIYENVSSTKQAKIQKGFFSKTTYTYLEVSDEDVMYLRQYNLKNNTDVQDALNFYLENPSEISCDSLYTQDFVTYGFLNDQLTLMIFTNNDQLTLVSFGNEITQNTQELLIQEFK